MQMFHLPWSTGSTCYFELALVCEKNSNWCTKKFLHVTRSNTLRSFFRQLKTSWALRIYILQCKELISKNLSNDLSKSAVETDNISVFFHQWIITLFFTGMGIEFNYAEAIELTNILCSTLTFTCPEDNANNPIESSNNPSRYLLFWR